MGDSASFYINILHMRINSNDNPQEKTLAAFNSQSFKTYYVVQKFDLNV